MINSSRKKYHFSRIGPNQVQQILERDPKLLQRIQQENFMKKVEDQCERDCENTLKEYVNLKDNPNPNPEIQKLKEVVVDANILLNFDFKMWQLTQAKLDHFENNQKALKATKKFIKKEIEWDELKNTYTDIYSNWKDLQNLPSNKIQIAEFMQDQILENFLDLEF